MSEEFSFLEYLTQQPPARLDALYESQWTCMATFRALPPLAKHYVMRLLFVDSVPLGERQLPHRSTEPEPSVPHCRVRSAAVFLRPQPSHLPVPTSGALRACVNADGTARHEESMKRMRKLRILKVERSGPPLLSISSFFPVDESCQPFGPWATLRSPQLPRLH